MNSFTIYIKKIPDSYLTEINQSKKHTDSISRESEYQINLSLYELIKKWAKIIDRGTSFYK